jgi:TP901 family phage tail tape measure protein
MSATLGSLVYFIRAKNQEFIQTMKDTENKLKDTKNEFERTSRKIKEVGTTFTVAGAVIIGTIIGLTGKSRELNAELANIGTLIPGNIKRLKELKNEIRNVAIETGKSTKDLAAGTYQLISAFGDTADTIDKLKVNAKAAKAGIAETTDAINLTSAVTKAYGDVSAEATQKMTDLAFMTVKLGQTTFPELAQSIGKVAPFAAQLNISAEEMFNTFATLTGVTGQTAEVSTQIAALVRAFLTQTEDMKAAFKELKKQGYETASQLLADKGLVGALKAVIATTEGSDEAIAKLFGSAESLLAVFALTGSQADTFSHKLEQMKKASGALDEAFKEQTEGINEAGHKWEQTMVRIEVAVQKLGDVAAPAFAVISGTLENLVGLLEKLADKIERLPKPLQKIIGVLTALSGILLALTGPILMLIGWLPNIISGMKIMKTLIPAVTAGMKGLTASFAPLLIGGAIIAGLMKVVGYLKKIREEQKLIAKDADTITDKDLLKDKIAAHKKQVERRKKVVSDQLGQRAFAKDGQLDEKFIEDYTIAGMKAPIVQDYLKSLDAYNAAVNRLKDLSKRKPSKVKTGGEDFVCPQCGKKFKTQAELDAHMKTHTKGSGVKDERTAYEQAKDQFERQAFYQNMSLEQEQEYWKKYVAVKAKGAEEVFESDKWLSDNQKQIDEDNKKTIEERAQTEEDRRKKTLANLEDTMQHEIEIGRATSQDLIGFYEKVLETQNLSEEEYIQYYRKLESLKKEAAEKDKAVLEEQKTLTDDWQQKAEDVSRTTLERRLDRIEREREEAKEAATDIIQDQTKLKQTLTDIDEVYDDQRLQAIVESLNEEYKLRENMTAEEMKLVKKLLEAKLQALQADTTANKEQIEAYRKAVEEISKSIDTETDKTNANLKESTADLLADFVLKKKSISDIWQELMEELVRQYIKKFIFKITSESGSLTKIFENIFKKSGDIGNGSSTEGFVDSKMEKRANNAMGTGGVISGIANIIGAIGSIFGYSGGGLVPAAANGMIVPNLPDSFGTDRVLSALTPQEMVLPVDISKYIIDSARQSKNNNVKQGDVHFHFNCIDGENAAKFIYDNRDSIVGIVQSNRKNGGVLRGDVD